jgi:hypothetical protein
MLTARAAAFLRDAGELADVNEDMPDAGHVAVDDVDTGAVVELGVQQSVGRIQLAVGTGRVVEQLGRGRSTWSSSWKTSSWYPDAPRAVLRDDGPAPLVLRATFKLANVRRTS